MSLHSSRVVTETLTMVVEGTSTAHLERVMVGGLLLEENVRCSYGQKQRPASVSCYAGSPAPVVRGTTVFKMKDCTKNG